MQAKTFEQGVHPCYKKEATASKSLKAAQIPEEVVIPLQQHIGAPCEALVEVGDKVKAGQKIGDSDSFVSAPIHASVSGEVIDIGPVSTADGSETVAVTISSDGHNTLHESVEPKGDIESLSSQELRDIVREAGIVGLGGATFPTHVKVSVPDDKNVDTVILNGAECEPYLTVDHRTMLEMPNEVVYGLKAIMKMTEADNGYIGIELNKPDAIEVMRETVRNEPNIKVIPLEVKYPQGAEKQLITACIDREVPSGGLPLDVGVVVNNIGTAVAITDAINNGMPLIQRTVTITGSGVQSPQNLVFSLGTKLDELIEQCGGFKGNTGKVILGGPMMGIAQHSTDVPATKGTSGILIFQKDEIDEFKPKHCIRCARCVDVCPVSLMPITLSKLAQVDMITELDDYNIFDCIECGSCSYICPAKIPLLHWIKLGKSILTAEERKNDE
ncbi:electron transport complex subunit RsxC [Selenihalanaerobacter shriftii]|uniref:Ion-translocating oxidoreductase complex subunit C n=1 Tax=Selenihalanaerobacter shriftii TaxID=142842 RepID=A0A1T4MK39_9FIRM|nr:electron transport complex subunit RsxC [Selenihalanaerobacter shriftii]SJZ67313.1 electron transport complex protein RnfC [Selenihalanaerobacter shriftii]